MADDDVSQYEVDDLRRRAEALWRQRPAHAGGAPPDEARALFHELEVHQIELEMQNEELHRAQVELAAAHARYFDLFDLAPVGYLTLEARGLILEANLAAAQLLGSERRQLVGHPLRRAIVPADRDIYYLHEKRLAHSRQAETCEVRLQRRDGALCWVRLQSVLAQGSDGAQVCRITLSNITAGRQAEEQIRFQAGLLQAVEQAVIVTDLAMTAIYWNRFAEELYGWPAREALGHGLRELFMSHVSAEQAQPLVASLQSGGSWSGDVEVTRKSGEALSAFFTFSPVQDQQGQLAGAISVSREDTPRRQRENDLSLNCAQLHNLSRRLVASQEGERQYVAHQLYNDEGQRLAALLLGLGRLEGQAEGYPAVVGLIGELEELADGLMHDLHGLAVHLRPASLDRLGLPAALAQYADDFGRQHHLQIGSAFHGLDGEHLSREVETAIYRVVQEALANIAQHARATQVTIVVQKRGAAVLAIVEDNGIGFDVDEGFRRERAGLVEMRERAEALGGHLYVESAPGHGTTIYASVPEAGPGRATVMPASN
jgi:PAS domain S-box-containing protein